MRGIAHTFAASTTARVPSTLPATKAARVVAPSTPAACTKASAEETSVESAAASSSAPGTQVTPARAGCGRRVSART